MFLLENSPMVYSNAWKSGTAVLTLIGLSTGAVAPLMMPAPSFAQTAFPDVSSSYWAAPFINALVARGVITGFPDGTFRPEEPVTRAQFAAMLNKAFNKAPVRNPINFGDVPSGYWGSSAIRQAYVMGFMAGYPGNVFRPEENIPRAQVLVSLANGLNYASAGQVDQVLLAYSDAASIPDYARPSIAAATEKRLVVNYPNLNVLSPNRVATRADVAAFIYQALASTGQVAQINSPYIVGGPVTPPPPTAIRIPSGTVLPVRYEGAEKILLAQDEPQPTPLVLKIAQNIVTADGQVLIPVGSDVVGQLVTTDGGAQFIASELVLPNGARVPMQARSEVITTTERITKGTSIGRVVTGALIGSGAAAAIAGVTGDRTIKAGEVLIGTGLGALAGAIFGRQTIDLLAIDPDADLTLTLGSDLQLPAR